MKRMKRKEIVSSVVAILLVLAVLGAIVAGAVGYDESDESLVFIANLAFGGVGYAFAGLIAYGESEWRLWTLPYAVGLAIAGSVFAVIAFAAPWTTGWFFALIAALIF
jgi:hypothetical protein